MPTAQIDVRELPTRWTELLSLGAGTEVVIMDGGIPQARLLILSQSRRRVAGLHAGAIQTSEDFDAPLAESFWLGTS